MQIPMLLLALSTAVLEAPSQSVSEATTGETEIFNDFANETEHTLVKRDI